MIADILIINKEAISDFNEGRAIATMIIKILIKIITCFLDISLYTFFVLPLQRNLKEDEINYPDKGTHGWIIDPALLHTTLYSPNLDFLKNYFPTFLNLKNLLLFCL
jgi:hypothetical protein